MKWLLILLPMLLANKCSNELDVKIYAGDSKNQSINRAQDNEIIYTNDPRFDNFACLSYEDVEKIAIKLKQCEE